MVTANLAAVLEIATATDAGRVRPHNEDSIAADAGIGHAVLADGLSDMIPDQGIHDPLSTLQSDLPLAAQKLVQFANDSGGRDNISVILVRVRDDFGAPGGWFARFRASFRRYGAGMLPWRS